MIKTAEKHAISISYAAYSGFASCSKEVMAHCASLLGAVTNFDYVLILLIFRVCHTTESKSDFGLLLAANR